MRKTFKILGLLSTVLSFAGMSSVYALPNTASTERQSFNDCAGCHGNGNALNITISGFQGPLETNKLYQITVQATAPFDAGTNAFHFQVVNGNTLTPIPNSSLTDMNGNALNNTQTQNRTVVQNQVLIVENDTSNSLTSMTYYWKSPANEADIPTAVTARVFFFDKWKW